MSESGGDSIDGQGTPDGILRGAKNGNGTSSCA